MNEEAPLFPVGTVLIHKCSDRKAMVTRTGDGPSPTGAVSYDARWYCVEADIDTIVYYDGDDADEQIKLRYHVWQTVSPTTPAANAS